MRLTEEQQKTFEGYIGLLNAKIGIHVDAKIILSDMYKGLDEKRDFQQVYEETYAKALKDQMISGIVDNVSKGEQVPESAGTYLGVAMDYLFDSLADSKTKEKDPFTIAKNLSEESEELKKKADALKKDWKKKYEGLKLKAAAEITRVENEHKDTPEYKDLLLDAEAELAHIKEEEAKENEAISSILEHSKESRKNAVKLRGENPHHLRKKDLDKMITHAFQSNISKLDSIPRYKFLADDMEAKMENNEYYSKYQISHDMIKMNFDNLHADMRHGDLTVEDFKSYIGSVSEAYMVANYKYNKLGFFKKWFTSAGRDLRNDMENIKDPLNEAKEYLLRRAKTPMDVDTIKSINIRNTLHELGTRNSELVGQHRLAIQNIMGDLNEEVDAKELKEENVFQYLPENTKHNIDNSIQQIEIEELREVREVGPILDNNDSRDSKIIQENQQEKVIEDETDLFNGF